MRLQRSSPRKHVRHRSDAVAAAGSIWVLLRDDPDSPRLLKIDESTHEITATIDLAGAYGRRLIVASGYMFAMVATPVGGPIDGSLLYQIDTASNEVAGVLDLGAYAPVAGGLTQLWAATGNTLVRIDPVTAKPLGEPVSVGNTGDALAIGEGGVWFFDPARDRAISRFNPVTEDVDVTVHGVGGIAMAAWLGVHLGCELSRLHHPHRAELRLRRRPATSYRPASATGGVEAPKGWGCSGRQLSTPPGSSRFATGAACTTSAWGANTPAPASWCSSPTSTCGFLTEDGELLRALTLDPSRDYQAMSRS